MITLIHCWNALPDTIHYAALHDLGRMHLLTLVARAFSFFGHPIFEDGSIR